MSALYGDELSASHPGRFTPGTHCIEGWYGSCEEDNNFCCCRKPNAVFAIAHPYPSHYTERIILLFLADLRPHTSVESQRMLHVEPYLHSVICIHGVVLKKYTDIILLLINL
jgi:hypothetical protein